MHLSEKLFVALKIVVAKENQIKSKSIGLEANLCIGPRTFIGSQLSETFLLWAQGQLSDPYSRSRVNCRTLIAEIGSTVGPL